MNTTSKILIGILVVVLVGFGIYAFTHGQTQQLAGYSPSSSISAQTGEALNYQSNQNAPLGSPTIDSNGGFFNNNLGDVVTSGTFSPVGGQSVTNGAPQVINYTGSTTLFSIQNPFGATTTLQYGEVYGTDGTSSIALLVGTSTQPTGISNGGFSVANNISPTIINASLSTSTQFFTASGVTVGSAAGFQSAGTGSFTEIQVGPNDYVVGYATTTYSNTPGGVTSITDSARSKLSGTYSFEWYR